MPHYVSGNQHRINPDEVYRLLDSGLSQGAVARQLGCNQAHISRLAKRRRDLAPTNGHHPTALQRVEVVLEAFMAAQQSTQRTLSASAHSDAPQRAEPVEWISQGSHFAADMLPRIKAYMARHRLEKREVVDLALRRLLAEEDQSHG